MVERDRRVTSPSLPRAYPFVPKRGAGSVVEDVDGNIFLDLNAGIAVTSTGHCHPRVVEAVQEQATELLHYSASDFYLPAYTEVCERLDAMAPFGGRPARIVPDQLGDGGGGGRHQARPLRHRPAVPDRLLPVVPRAHHGERHAHGQQGEVPDALRPDAAVGLPLVLRRLRPPRRRVVHPGSCRPTRSPRSWSRPGSAKAGTSSHPTGGSGTCETSATQHGILLVVDEVQCGMGRSGTTWAIEQEGVEPDIVISGKGIASGLPLGAMIAREDLMLWSWARTDRPTAAAHSRAQPPSPPST